MKFYIYTIIILITLGFTLAGCSQQKSSESTTKENLSPSRNKAVAEESKIGTDPDRKDSQEMSDESLKAITIYKSPTCGCCTMWEDHLTKAGFKVTSKKTDDMEAVRKRYNVPEKAQSCHTGIIGGYVIEGHVPAADIEKLLKTRPSEVVGLAAPGMPPKSPGMQPEGEKPSGYDVLSFDKNGQMKVFSSY